jgi:hypothetical protein
MNSERQMHAHSHNSGFESDQKGASARSGSAICWPSENGECSFYGNEFCRIHWHVHGTRRLFSVLPNSIIQIGWVLSVEK